MACDHCASTHAAIPPTLKVAPETVEAHLAGQSDNPRTGAILTLATAVITAKDMVPDPDLAAGLRKATPFEIEASENPAFLRLV